MRISDWSSDVCSSDLCFGGSAQFRTSGPQLQPFNKIIDAIERWRAVAPIEKIEPGKSMVLDPVALFISEAGLAPLPAQTADGAVTLMPTGTTGDLRHLSDGQPTNEQGRAVGRERGGKTGSISGGAAALKTTK